MDRSQIGRWLVRIPPVFRQSAPLAALLLAGTLVGAGEPVTALSGLDPVLLTEGLEVVGKPGTQIVDGRYRYFFADSENQNKFRSAPERYGIQFDGYCMKMGPLSGRGSPDRWLVANGRIYLFASESCRDQFRADPAAYTDHADAPPTGNAASKERGRGLIALALAGFGGVEPVDALKNIRWEATTIYEQAGKKMEMRQAATLILPDQFRLDYSYGDVHESHELANGRLVEINARQEVTSLPADVYEFVRRRLFHEPLALLRARNEPGFIAVAAGTGKVEDQPVAWLRVGYAGATTKLGIDPGTGRILAAEYLGRAPVKIGEICRTYSDFKTLEGGLVLPQQWAVAYGGVPASESSRTVRSVRVNVPLPPK